MAPTMFTDDRLYGDDLHNPLPGATTTQLDYLPDGCSASDYIAGDHNQDDDAGSPAVSGR